MVIGRTPLYYQVSEAVRTRITSGEYPVGGQLPTENALMAEFDVGRVTVRTALQQLCQEGLIERFVGRGTFVLDRSYSRSRWTLDSVEDIIEYSRAQKYVVLDTAVISSPGEELKRLFDVGPTQKLLLVRTLRSSAQGPYGFSKIHLPNSIASRVPKKLLPTSPILLLIREHAGVVANRMRQVTSSALADAEAAEVLQVPPDMPLLVMARTYYREEGTPIMHSLVRARPDRYEQIVNFFQRSDKYNAGRNAPKRDELKTTDVKQNASREQARRFR